MNDITRALEAILFAAGDPVPLSRLSLVLQADETDILSAFDELNKIYLDGNHSIYAYRLGDKLQLCSTPEFSHEISKILETRKPPMLSTAALEALAIIAYYQPTTLAFINKVRGVDSSYSVGTLVEKGLIQQCGRLEAPGRPVLYSTTDVFLRTMNISELSQLPPLPDMKHNDAIEKLMSEIDHLTTSANSDAEAVIPIPGQIGITEDISD